MADWTYQGESFTSDDIGAHIGFVYELCDTVSGKKYIGKKKFQRKVTRPPLKGKKRKRRSLAESDWQAYCGSSEEIKLLVEEDGLDRFKRTILHLCSSLGEMSYVECYYQVVRGVLLRPDEYFNGIIQVRIHRNHVKNISPPDYNNCIEDSEDFHKK